MPKEINKRKTSGFTLVELLVVVGVIAVLAGVFLIVVNPSGIRAKARDSQRKSDLSKIQVALELYFADNRRYPNNSSITWRQVWPTGYMSDVLINGGYISTVPIDPLNDINYYFPCAYPDRHRYMYTEEDSAGSGRYMLVAFMEVATSNDGNECHNLPNWGQWDACPSFGSALQDVCYGVQNP